MKGTIIGNTNYNEWKGASILIQVDENTQIFCLAEAGTSPSESGWQISKLIQSTDSLFTGYPYQRTLWAVNPATGKPPSQANSFMFKATDIFTLPLDFA